MKSKTNYYAFKNFFWLIGQYLGKVRNLKVFVPLLIPHFISLSTAQFIRSESIPTQMSTEYNWIIKRKIEHLIY